MLGEGRNAPRRVSDGVIDLILEELQAADPSKGYVPALHYRIALHGTDRRVGAIRLRIGYTPALLAAGHIGFDVEESYRGHNFAARACLIVRGVARAQGLTSLIITCDPSNIASRRTCEKVGARLEGIFDVPPDHWLFRKGYRQVCRYIWDGSGTDGR